MRKVTARIIKFNSNLLTEKVEIKYRKMSETLFSFYRGTNHLFYEDLSNNKGVFPHSPVTWICGDLHIENFGSYKSDNGLVYFDLNDFDEAILAPANWEIVRMLTSIFVAFSALKIKEEKATRMANLFLKVYFETLSKGKADYIEPQTAKGIVCAFLSSQVKTNQENLMIKKTVDQKGKTVLLKDGAKHFVIEKQLRKRLKEHIKIWIRQNRDSPYNYKVRDIVFRVAGTGSIGVKRYLFLLQSTLNKKDYLLLDMKQATVSSLLSFIKIKQPAWNSEAERVITVGGFMQSKTAALLSTIIFENDSFVLEEMQPESDKINFQLIKNRYRDVYQVISDMAMLTAFAQLRSTGRKGSVTADRLIAFGIHFKDHHKLIEYSSKYARQVGNDYITFLKDYKKGELMNKLPLP
jgi:uncharacterized protein (DUF2252 family)